MTEKETFVNELKATQEQLAQTQEKLRQLESQHQNLLNHLDGEVQVWKVVRYQDNSIQTWKLMDVNSAALKNLGKTREEVIGKTTQEIFGEEALELFKPIVVKLFEECKPQKWTEYFDATEQYLQMTSLPQGDYFISTGKDITDEINTKHKLEESKSLLEQTESISNQGTWKYDILNDEWTYSENWLKIFGLDDKPGAEELTAAVHPDDRTVVTEAFRKAVQGKENYNIEHRIIDKSGSVLWVKVAAELMEDNKNRCLIGAKKDITKEKQILHKLLDNPEFLRKTENIATVGGWLLEGAFDKPYWTEGTYDIHEVSYDYSLTTEEAINFYHPDDREMVSASVSTAIENGEVFEFEARIITAKGNLK